MFVSILYNTVSFVGPKCLLFSVIRLNSNLTFGPYWYAFSTENDKRTKEKKKKKGNMYIVYSSEPVCATEPHYEALQLVKCLFVSNGDIPLA